MGVVDIVLRGRDCLRDDTEACGMVILLIDDGFPLRNQSKDLEGEREREVRWGEGGRGVGFKRFELKR